MVIFTSILVLSMIVFSNVLFYTVVLLFMSTFVLVYLVASDIMSILVLLLILIVYVGAMMILIGYICAVCPNFITVTTTPHPQAILGLLIFIFFVNQFKLSESAKTIYLLDYFLSYWGMLSFFMIVVMLFFTLLMVTSQYSSPQGPFRSLN